MIVLLALSTVKGVKSAAASKLTIVRNTIAKPTVTLQPIKRLSYAFKEVSLLEN